MQVGEKIYNSPEAMAFSSPELLFLLTVLRIHVRAGLPWVNSGTLCFSKHEVLPQASVRAVDLVPAARTSWPWKIMCGLNTSAGDSLDQLPVLCVALWSAGRPPFSLGKAGSPFQSLRRWKVFDNSVSILAVGIFWSVKMHSGTSNNKIFFFLFFF